MNLEPCSQLPLGSAIQPGDHQLIDLMQRQTTLHLTGPSGNWRSLLTSVNGARKPRKLQRNRFVRKLSEKGHSIEPELGSRLAPPS